MALFELCPKKKNKKKKKKKDAEDFKTCYSQVKTDLLQVGIFRSRFKTRNPG